MPTIKIGLNEKNRPDLFDILICMSFSYNTVLVFFSAVFAKIPIISLFGYQIMPFVVSVVAILCIISGYFYRVRFKDIVFIFCFLVVVGLSFLIHPETRPYFYQTNLRKIYVEAIPFFLLGLSMRCDQRILRMLTKLSYFAIVLNIVYMLWFVKYQSVSVDYYMGQAYFMLPHILFSINSIFDREIIRHRGVEIIFSIIGFIFLVALGTRGPVLIVVVYLLAKLFFSLDSTKSKVAVTLLALLAILLIQSNFYVVFLKSISMMIEKLGMSNRVITILLNNEYLSYTSGRDVIYDLLIGKISNGPLLGYGIFGEEQFGVFAHSIPIEILVYYGIPIGILIMILYTITVVRAYLKSQNKCAKEILLLFIVLVFAHAPFGGSHLSYYFFFLLGLSITELREWNRLKY